MQGGPTPFPPPLSIGGVGVGVFRDFQNPYSGRKKNGISDFLGREKEKDAHFRKIFSKKIFLKIVQDLSFTDPDVPPHSNSPPPHQSAWGQGIYRIFHVSINYMQLGAFKTCMNLSNSPSS